MADNKWNMVSTAQIISVTHHPHSRSKGKGKAKEGKGGRADESSKVEATQKEL